MGACVTSGVLLPESLADRFAAANVDQRRLAMWTLPVERQRELAEAAQSGGHTPWWWEGRSDQFEPEGEWRWWIINAGRGWGKTRTGAEWTADKARRFPGCMTHMVAPTYTDARETMMEGVSGLLASVTPWELEGGSWETGWKISRGRLHFANGSVARLFTAERPMRLRGPQSHFVWGDEPSYWPDVERGTAKDSTFFNANIGLRLPSKRGWLDYRQRGLMTMTPRMVPLLKVDEETLRLHPERAGLLQRTDAHLTTGATVANLRNLDRAYFDAVVRPLLGTTLGLQELGGVLLEEVEGALWNRQMIENDRSDLPALRELSGTVVSFDPAGGAGATRDEHGIVVVSALGYQDERQWFVRADRSLNGTPDDAGAQVILAALEFDADAIVYEKNQGQDWIPAVINSRFATMKADGSVPADSVLPTLEPVSASTNKLQRATPVRGLYQQHRVHHTARLATLEGQMTSWVPGESDSPDRLDALVWGVSWLYSSGPTKATVASPARRERRGRRPGQPNTAMPRAYSGGGRSR